MKLPRGRLVRSRVVTDPRTVLVDALERETTGYAVLEPQESLLLDGEGSGVVTFEDGVPVVAYHTGTERGGPPALADLAAEGPYRLELFAVAAADLDPVHARGSFRVPPGMAAERLVGDQSLAQRTREAAPATRQGASARADGPAGDGAATPGAPPPGDGPDDDTPESPDRQVGAVEAFLDDEEKVEAIREAARAEAETRAEEWDF